MFLSRPELKAGQIRAKRESLGWPAQVLTQPKRTAVVFLGDSCTPNTGPGQLQSVLSTFSAASTLALPHAIHSIAWFFRALLTVILTRTMPMHAKLDQQGMVDTHDVDICGLYSLCEQVKMSSSIGSDHRIL